MRGSRAEAHYQAAAKYLQYDPKHPKAKAHMLRWAELRFGGLDAKLINEPTDPRELAFVMEDYKTMVGKYKTFSFDVGDRLADGTVRWKSSVVFPNENRRGDADLYEEYRSGNSRVLRIISLVHV